MALSTAVFRALDKALCRIGYATEVKTALNLATLSVQPGAGTAGSKVASGSVTLDGTNPTPITTGLTTVTGFAVMSVRSTAPALDPVSYNYTASAGAVSLYAWKHTSSSDPTLIASTDADDVITWIAVGT